MRSDSSRTARWSSPGGRDSSPGPLPPRLRRAVTRQLFIPPSRGIGSGVPFPSRTRFQPETWYGKETTYTPDASCIVQGCEVVAEEESPCEGPGCGAMIAFEVIGSELKLTVLHSLLSGPKRFNELRVATGMCQSSLAKRLKELEEVGIAVRKDHLDRPVAVEYRLSPKGAALLQPARHPPRCATRPALHCRPRDATP